MSRLVGLGHRNYRRLLLLLLALSHSTRTVVGRPPPPASQQPSWVDLSILHSQCSLLFSSFLQQPAVDDSPYSSFVENLATGLNEFAYFANIAAFSCFQPMVCLWLVKQLSFIKDDLEQMEFMMNTRENDLTEMLLPPRHSFLIRQSRTNMEMKILSLVQLGSEGAMNLGCYMVVFPGVLDYLSKRELL
ncbi:hypothetical protein Cgig2_008120 [Carnegiea gigantea]|uniref:Uncharacterized protein n=1 Tax=Carnegiea gigantea TaxID=171969 RepID=A0A9Q1KYN5_9CARY|nr:hypothetical protein Cgig2_008120 [Carnegiea gigantea]